MNYMTGNKDLGKKSLIFKRFKNSLGIDLSIDAQRELRDEEYNLDIQRLSTYLTETSKLFV